MLDFNNRIYNRKVLLLIDNFSIHKVTVKKLKDKKASFEDTKYKNENLKTELETEKTKLETVKIRLSI